MNLTDKFLQFALLGAEWVLWLLVALSVISVYVMLERFFFLNSVGRSDGVLAPKLLGALSERDLEKARSLVHNAPGAGARIVHEMLAQAERSDAAVEAAMNAARPGEKIRLERNLGWLGTLGANAPFIGLFGTVLGIIRAFEDLSKSGLQQNGDTTAVMAGISEALVATAVGLLVAIPAVVAYNYFQRRVKQLLSQADAMTNMTYGLVVSESPDEGAA